jgi:thioesterase domain-containing protein
VKCLRGAERAACDTRAVSTLDALGRELQSTWLREIPLAAAMAIEVASCARDELVVRAPLAPNRNVHGTAFAGSLFSLCVLTGWGATWLALRQRGLGGAIVVAESRIRYRRAVSGDIVCGCRPDLAVVERSLAGLAATGRASLPLVCTIDQDDKRAVTFEGEYVVHSKKEPHARA